MVSRAGATAPSYRQGSDDLKSNLWLEIDPKEIERITHRVGAARCAQRDAETERCMGLPLAERKAAPGCVEAPALAVVGVDGGRLQTRTGFAAQSPAAAAAAPAAAAGDDVPVPAGDGRKGKHWREDKIGVLMTMSSAPSSEDPCPEVPAAFLDKERIAKLARELKTRKSAAAEAEAAPGAAAPGSPAGTGGEGEAPAWEPPAVLSKDLAATRRPWAAFGPMMASAAWQRGFFAAGRRAFLGDGSDHVWTLWKDHFSSFVPVLDIIHAIGYLYGAAMAGRSSAAGWPCYERWMGRVWKGETDSALAEMRVRREELGPAREEDGETHPRTVVAAGVRYLENHQGKMKYADYRKQGLPITSSYVESSVKQFNQRVKGTEKFWTEAGAEAVLQLRADHLGTTPVLDKFWKEKQARETGMPRYAQAL